jgi:hypothetical protein
MALNRCFPGVVKTARGIITGIKAFRRRCIAFSSENLIRS